jgi:ankyrin repeat protein
MFEQPINCSTVNPPTIFCRTHYFTIPNWAIVTLIILALSSLASCDSKLESDKINSAARNGDLEKVKALLVDNPELVFSADSNGFTPLFVAVANHHKDIVKLLLDYKADVNARNINGGTPLYFTAFVGDKAMAEFLLGNKADVNARDNAGNTPLVAAAVGGYKNLVELLLDNKADINTRDNKGYTPFGWAEAGNREGVIELLRQRGGHE